MSNLDKLCDEAHEALKKILPPTPLIKNDYLSSKFEANIYLKLENLQPVGSFKLRGATFKISHLSDDEKRRGVLAVSAGNHAQGVAWAARRFNLDATIIMPKLSPMIKILNTEKLGAKVILHGDDLDAGFKYANELVQKNKMTFVHPFNDPYIIAGQSSLAYEVLDVLPDLDYFIAGIGGGGLLAGSANVLKRKSSAKIIGAQAAGASSMVKSLLHKKLESGTSLHTFADGIRVNPVQEMLDLLGPIVDDVYAISDEKIAKSVLTLMEHARIIAEGAGAISLAALSEMYEKDPNKIKGKNIVLVVSGGNIDINLVDRIIDQGLIESKRRVKFTVIIDDKPGMLTKLTQLVSSLEGNILQSVHDRNIPGLDLQKTSVDLTIETKGEAHAKKIEEELNRVFVKAIVKN